jgi:hypothetical protein
MQVKELNSPKLSQGSNKANFFEENTEAKSSTTNPKDPDTKSLHGYINNLNETLAAHREEIIEDSENKSSEDENSWKISKEFLNIVREKYPVVLSWFTVALHSAASSLPFIPFVPKQTAKKFKDWALAFSRYIVPLNMVHEAIEDLSGKRLFHAIARLAPPVCLPFLPFYNFSMPYGIFAGINFPTEEIVKRVGELSKHNTFAENNQKIIDGLKAMWNDFNNQANPFKERFRLGSIFFASASMLAGALGGLLFSPNSLNNIPATIFGFIRSTGGLVGDLNLILGKNHTKKEKTIGSLYAIGSLMDITQRWITDPTINELYNHAKTSLNTISTLLWTHMSTDRNRQEEKKVQKLHSKQLLAV